MPKERLLILGTDIKVKSRVKRLFTFWENMLLYELYATVYKCCKLCTCKHALGQ